MAGESSNGVYADWACELTVLYRANPNSSVVRSPNRRRKISEVTIEAAVSELLSPPPARRQLWHCHKPDTLICSRRCAALRTECLSSAAAATSTGNRRSHHP